MTIVINGFYAPCYPFRMARMNTWLMGLVFIGSAWAGVDSRIQFANDLGSNRVDVSAYPKVVQTGYAIFEKKCATCHSLARAVHSQFVELSEVERRKAVAAQPSIAGDLRIWQIESDIWKRYVKRMTNKPGSTITPSEAPQIYAFLLHDSKVRKIGSFAKKWEGHRTRLLKEFQKSNPARYKDLYEKEGRP